MDDEGVFNDIVYSDPFCLWVYRKRYLVLYHFLGRSGIRVHVCFGMRYKEELTTLDAKRLEGHAWLLYNGNVFLEKTQRLLKPTR
jgi:hypothetical protein